MRYVGVGRRFLAILIDGLIGFLWTWPFLDIERSPGYFQARLGTGGVVGSFAISLVYFTAMEALFGATIGKFVTGIRVVREDGSKLDGGAALIRNLARIVDVLPFAYLVGAISVWTSPIKQRLGDRWGKTVVVTSSSVGAGPAAPTGPPGSTWMPPAPGAPAPLPSAGPGAPTSSPPPMPPPPPVPAAAPPASPPPEPASPPPEPASSHDPWRAPAPAPADDRPTDPPAPA